MGKAEREGSRGPVASMNQQVSSGPDRDLLLSNTSLRNPFQRSPRPLSYHLSTPLAGTAVRSENSGREGGGGVDMKEVMALHDFW